MSSRQVVIKNGAELDELCTNLINDLIEHQWIKVTVEVDNRSLDQNALYWRWIRQITIYLNKKNKSDFKEDEIHWRMKHDHLGWTTERKIGSVVIPPQIKSTRECSKGEMVHYLDRLDAAWAQMGLLLEKPDDSEYVKLKKKMEQ